MRLWAWVCGLLVCCLTALVIQPLITAPALADVTINNFNTSVSVPTEIARFDANQNQIDAVDQGQIIQTGTCPGAGCLFYWIGTSHGCAQNPAYMLGNYGHWCGFYSRASVDLKNWGTPTALVATPTLNSTCAITGSGGAGGCWANSCIWNAANSYWACWHHVPGVSVTTAGMFTCTTLSGPCTVQTAPTGLAQGPNVGSMRLFLDDDGTSGYIIYNAPGGSGSRVYVQALTANFKDATGSATSVTPTGDFEAPALFKKGSTYYAMYGPNCAYCNGAANLWRSASSPLGTWSAPTTMTSTACGGQLAGVDKLTISAADVYLYHTDLWYGNSTSGPNNQGLTNQYFDQLTFTGSSIDSLTCKTSVTIANLTEVPNPQPPQDQGDTSADFQLFCDVGTVKRRLQTFVPTVSHIANIYPIVGTGTTTSASECSFPSTSCGQIDGNLVIDFVSVDGSNNPSAPIVSTSFTTGQIPWSAAPVTVSVNQDVTPGNTYGIIWRGTNTAFSYCFAYSDAHPYASGVERQSVNSGATWSTETNRSLRFWTDPASLITPYAGLSH